MWAARFPLDTFSVTDANFEHGSGQEYFRPHGVRGRTKI